MMVGALSIAFKGSCKSLGICESKTEVAQIFTWIGERIHKSDPANLNYEKTDFIISFEFFAIASILTLLAILLARLSSFHPGVIENKTIKKYETTILTMPLILWIAVLNGLDATEALPVTWINLSIYAWILAMSYLQWLKVTRQKPKDMSSILYMFPGSLSVNICALFVFQLLLSKKGLGGLTASLYYQHNIPDIILTITIVLSLFCLVQDTSEYAAEFQKA
jgi:hypothetical protein